VFFFLLIKYLTVNVAPPVRKRIELIGSGATAVATPKLGLFGGILRGGLLIDSARNDGMLAGGVSNGGASNGGAPNRGLSNGSVRKGGASTGGISSKNVIKGGVLNGGVSTGGVLAGGVSNGSCAFDKLGNVNVININIMVKNNFFIFASFTYTGIFYNSRKMPEQEKN
jgi:hypothetical protein